MSACFCCCFFTVCNAGFGRSGTTCVACTPGQYKPGPASNNPCTLCGTTAAQQALLTSGTMSTAVTDCSMCTNRYKVFFTKRQMLQRFPHANDFHFVFQFASQATDSRLLALSLAIRVAVDFMHLKEQLEQLVLNAQPTLSQPQQPVVAQ